MTKLEQFDYAGAITIGTGMLVISLVTLLVLKLIQKRWEKKW